MTIRNAMPLIALDAIVLDTETTGLDPSKARLIEIGAVRLRGGQLYDKNAFRRLIRPPEPVPPVSTAVHGINDLMLANAPPFEALRDDVRKFIDGELVIGHSIGFDLAILANEFRRAGAEWKKPRALCTRMLAEVVEPNLPDYSLERVAAWLGVTSEGRHSALGDATMTARVFLTLAPKLRRLGIQTLAEAEAAIHTLTNVLDEQRRAGWEVPVSSIAVRNQPEHFARDLYPYRNRVAAVMRQPIVVHDDLTVGHAIERLMSEKISSLLVAAKPAARWPPEILGIVTERDLLRAIASSGPAALVMPVGPLASRPLLTVAADAFDYRAIGRMGRLRVRHLGVTDSNGAVCGIISARDLLKLCAHEAIWLGDEIDEAPDALALARAWSQVPDIAAALRRDGASGREVAALVSFELRALTSRAAQLAERQMVKDSFGAAPCRYAVAVLGSAGRGESLLALDQDNALVFAVDSEEAERWFAAFSRRLADLLHEAGVPYCAGGVMASNAEWRGSVATWRARIDKWINTSDPKALLSVDIFFDMVGIHGDVSLTSLIRREAFEKAAGNAGFAKLLVESTGGITPALGLFGSIRTENGRVDLKRAALFGIVTTARTLAIRHNISEHATQARLDRIIGLRLGNERDLEALREGQGLLLDLLADQQIDDITNGLPPSNTVVVKRLSPGVRDRLRSVLAAVGNLDELTRDLLFPN